MMDLLDSIGGYMDEEKERGIEIVNADDVVIEDVKVDASIVRADGTEDVIEMVKGDFIQTEITHKGRQYPQEALANFETNDNGEVVPSIQSPANMNNAHMQQLVAEMMNQEANTIKPKKYNPKKKSKKKMAKQSRMKNRKRK